jgi:hypothetical protein
LAALNSAPAFGARRVRKVRDDCFVPSFGIAEQLIGAIQQAVSLDFLCRSSLASRGTEWSVRIRAIRGTKTVKCILSVAAALSLLSTAAFAGANYDIKGTSNTDTMGNGNMVSTYSSSGTGNGGVVGGNGTSYDNSGIDQTTTPASRAEAVHSLGVGNANGLANGNNGNGSVGNNGSHR